MPDLYNSATNGVEARVDPGAAASDIISLNLRWTIPRCNGRSISGNRGMTHPPDTGRLTAILPCNDLDASERFYNRLGFTRPDEERPPPGEPDAYRMLSNGKGGFLHLTERSRAGSCRAGTRSVFICTTRMSTPWHANSGAKRWGSAVRKSSPGVCTN